MEVLIYLAIGSAIVCLIVMGPYLYFTSKVFIRKLYHNTGIQKPEDSGISPPATSVKELKEAEEIR